MNGLAVGIAACAAWMPGRERWVDWAAASGRDVPASADETRTPPVQLRRRVSEIGQKALRAAWQLPGVGTARFVFASQHGEFDRTTAISRALIAGEPPSPAEFSLSVHNALCGLLSIAAANRAGHTTIAAGVDSFCCGLLEAAACIAETPAAPVILVSYDAPLPAPYGELIDETGMAPHAVALQLAPHGSGRWNIRIRRLADLDAPGHPAPALAFLDFLLAGSGAASCAGDRCVWRWQHA